jgi:hypothetical protein
VRQEQVALQDHQDPLVPLEAQDLLEIQAILVHKVKQDLQGLKVLLAIQVQLEHQVAQAQQVHQAFLVQQDP